MDIWQELEIAPTDDRGAILRAYAQRLSKVRPEDDPEGAERLRLAYEAALSGAYDSVAPPPPEAPSREERLEASRRTALERAAAALVAAGPEAPVREERAPDRLFGDQVPPAESQPAPLPDPPMEPAVEIVDPPPAESEVTAAAVDDGLNPWLDPTAAVGSAEPAAFETGLGGDGASDSWSQSAAPDRGSTEADPLGPGIDPLAPDPLAADPLTTDPPAAEPVAADPLAAEPLAAAPLAADPLAVDPPTTEPLAADPVAPASRATTLGDLTALQAPEAEPESALTEDLDLGPALGEEEAWTVDPDPAPAAPPPLAAAQQETEPDDGGPFARARGRRSQSIRAGQQRSAPKRAGPGLGAWRERLSAIEPLLAWCDRLRAFLASNKYAEMAVLVVVLIAFGMATFYGSPFHVIGAGVALLCLSGLMRPGSGLLLLFGTLASWLGSIVLMRQGALPVIDKATLFMLLLLMVFGMIRLADRLEERAASRTGR